MIELDTIITIQDEEGNDIGDFFGFTVPQETPYQLKTNVKGLKTGCKIITKTGKFVIVKVNGDEYIVNKIEDFKKED